MAATRPLALADLDPALLKPSPFAAHFLKIINKSGRLLPLEHNLTQRYLLQQRTRRDLILKSRQRGVSTFLQGDLTRLHYTRTVSTATLAHDNTTTQRFRRMTDRFYNLFPESIRPERYYNNATVSTFPDFDSEAIIATAGNTDVGRGGTYTHLHLSEVGFFRDAADIMAGIMQGGNPAIAAETTPNGAQGWFYETWMQSRALAAAGQPAPWNLIFLPWFTDETCALALEPDETVEFDESEQTLARLMAEQYGLALAPEQVKFRRAKQLELRKFFPQEYPENPVECFLTSGLAYFGILDDDVWTAQPPPDLDRTHRHVGGLDFGQKHDFTVLSVLDATARQQVDLLRVNNRSWDEMRGLVRDAAKRWALDTLVVEVNSIGGPNLESLIAEFDRDALPTTIVPFETTGESKAQIMGDLYIALHEDNWRMLPDDDQRQEFRIFESRQLPSGRWQYGAPQDEYSHDDTVMACAFAIHAARHQRRGVWV